MAQRTHYRLNLWRSNGLWLALLAVLIFVAYHYVAPLPYRAIVWKEAQANRLNPYLVAAVIRVESSCRPDAVSPKGAVGLMQLIPSTAQWASQKADNRSISVQALYDPAVNIHLGTWYLNQLFTGYHGNQVLGLAAYNAGSRNVGNWMAQGLLTADERSSQNIPFPETKNFVRRVLFYQKVYQSLYAIIPAPHSAAAQFAGDVQRLWNHGL
jgi:soluble lytic murein transglycosylase